MLGGQCKVFRKAKSLISQEKWSYVKSEYWRETENTATSTVRFLKLQLLLAHILQLDDHRREKIQGWFSDRLQLQMVPTEITKRKTSSLRLQQEVKDANAYLYLNLRFPSRFIYCFKKRFSLKAMICAHYLITPPYSSVKIDYSCFHWTDEKTEVQSGHAATQWGSSGQKWHLTVDPPSPPLTPWGPFHW